MMKVEPLVSVVMPVHDAGPFLREALESVLAQSFARWELIAVDDGSSDGSWDVLLEFAARDPRVRVLRQPRNLGIVATRNRAFAEASGESSYFAVLDSDDIALPDRLERQVAFLEAHPDYALVGGQTLIIDSESNEIGVRRYPLGYAQICRALTRYNPIAQPTVMIRRSVLAEVGVYDPHFTRCQDYDLWLRIATRHPIANLGEYTLRYRVSPTQGKRTHLRETLRLTLELHRRWLFHPRFFRPANVAYVALEHFLPLLPDRALLRLFTWKTYKRGDSSIPR